MAYTYEQLKDMTVAQLREIAQGIQSEAVQGYSTMHKDHLLPAMCKALGIEAHVHHIAALAAKTEVKKQIRALKAKRDEMAGSHDHKNLAGIRHQIRSLKRKLRKTAR